MLGRRKTLTLAAAGGGWGGVVAERPHLGDDPALSWTFTLRCEPQRRRGRRPESVTIDGVDLPEADWYAMAGRRVVCERFGEPVEATVYAGEPFPFERVDLRLEAQVGPRLLVVATLAGDRDGFGAALVDVQGWLDMTGVEVAIPRLRSEEEARAALAELTDATGLHGEPSRSGYGFSTKAHGRPAQERRLEERKRRGPT